MRNLMNSIGDGWSSLAARMTFGNSPMDLLVRGLVQVKGFIVRGGEAIRSLISALQSWLSVLDNRGWRGVADRCVACVDGLIHVGLKSVVISFLTEGEEIIQSLANVLGGFRIRILSPWVAMVLALAVVVGIAAQADAQTSRYTLDDVMDKLDDVVDKMIEMDKRLSVVETEVKRNRELIETVNTNLTKQIETVNTNLTKQIETVNTNLTKQIETVNTNLTKQIETVNTNLGDRISGTDTTMRWLFGFLGSLFLGILVLTFATYKNTASLVKPTERSVAKDKISEAFRKEVREEIAEREKALEKRLQAADRSVPKVLEALEQKVSALAERQKELEGKLTPAKAV